jgi:hypothetical protein
MERECKIMWGKDIFMWYSYLFRIWFWNFVGLFFRFLWCWAMIQEIIWWEKIFPLIFLFTYFLCHIFWLWKFQCWLTSRGWVIDKVIYFELFGVMLLSVIIFWKAVKSGFPEGCQTTQIPKNSMDQYLQP